DDAHHDHPPTADRRRGAGTTGARRGRQPFVAAASRPGQHGQLGGGGPRRGGAAGPGGRLHCAGPGNGGAARPAGRGRPGGGTGGRQPATAAVRVRARWSSTASPSTTPTSATGPAGIRDEGPGARVGPAGAARRSS